MNNKRSSHIPFDRKAKTENFRRSAHEDFATSSELRARKFNGWRENQISNSMELWIEGEIVKEVHVTTLIADPKALEKAYSEHFAQDL